MEVFEIKHVAGSDALSGKYSLGAPAFTLSVPCGAFDLGDDDPRILRAGTSSLIASAVRRPRFPPPDHQRQRAAERPPSGGLLFVVTCKQTRHQRRAWRLFEWRAR